jgi:hypothetical protein
MMIHRVGGNVNDFGEAIAPGLAGLGPLPERLGLTSRRCHSSVAVASGGGWSSFDPHPFHADEAAAKRSPGIDELRWLKPVRPGDTLSLRMTILETIPSRTKSDRGLVSSRMEMENQRGEVVLTIRGLSLLGCRPA